MSIFKKFTKVRNSPSIETKYHPNGEVESKTPYVNGKKHGAATWWNEDGKKYLEQMWRDGKKHGLETWWYISGKKWQEIPRQAGERYGVKTSWWESGQKEREIYQFGSKDYAHIQWDESGNVTEISLPKTTIISIITPIIKPIIKFTNERKNKYHL